MGFIQNLKMISETLRTVKSMQSGRIFEQAVVLPDKNLMRARVLQDIIFSGFLRAMAHSEEEQRGMRDKVHNLLKATQALVAYIEEHHVFDRLADAGCGLYDTYRSDDFEKVFRTAKQAARELEEELAATG